MGARLLKRWVVLPLKEKQFIEDMTWDSIEIDHKIPITWFKSNTPLILINDLRNLQPLFIKDNRDKAASYCYPIDKDYDMQSFSDFVGAVNWAIAEIKKLNK
jgi:hypothetical protein